MSRTLPLKIRTRPVPTPLILDSPVPFSPIYKGVWAPQLSDKPTVKVSSPMESPRSDKTLTPFMTSSLSSSSCQSSASVYSCDSCRSVDDWSEISLLSSQTPGVSEYLMQGLGLAGGPGLSDAKPNWEELREALNRPRRAKRPSALTVPEAREYLRKLRSRSLAALQLEGRRIHPDSPLPHNLQRSRSERITTQKPRPSLQPQDHLQTPIFTPSALLSSPATSPHPPLFTPSALLSPEEDTSQARPSRWERPRIALSDRNRGGGLALPSLPNYVPIEGLDTQQDEKLKVKGMRNGVIFTVAKMFPELSPCNGTKAVHWI